jgi:hypothetical protein
MPVSFWVWRGGVDSPIHTLVAFDLSLVTIGIVKFSLKGPEMSRDLLGCLSLKEMGTTALDALEHQTECVSSSVMIMVLEPTKSKTVLSLR